VKQTTKIGRFRGGRCGGRSRRLRGRNSILGERCRRLRAVRGPIRRGRAVR